MPQEAVILARNNKSKNRNAQQQTIPQSRQITELILKRFAESKESRESSGSATKHIETSRVGQSLEGRQSMHSIDTLGDINKKVMSKYYAPASAALLEQTSQNTSRHSHSDFFEGISLTSPKMTQPRYTERKKLPNTVLYCKKALKTNSKMQNRGEIIQDNSIRQLKSQLI